MPGSIASSSTPATPRRAANAATSPACGVIQIDPPSSPDVARSVAARDDLDHAFRQLSPEQRAVVVLHHHLGYPLTEIAATLGIPVGTARSRLHYAVRQLRAVLDADRSDARDVPGATRMNRSTEPDFDQRIADWLEEDPLQAPRAALDTVFAAYPSIPQRRAWRAPWRYVHMTTPMRLAAAAILGLLAFGGAIYMGVGASTGPRRTRRPSGRRPGQHGGCPLGLHRDPTGRRPRPRQRAAWVRTDRPSPRRSSTTRRRAPGAAPAIWADHAAAIRPRSLPDGRILVAGVPTGSWARSTIRPRGPGRTRPPCRRRAGRAWPLPFRTAEC